MDKLIENIKEIKKEHPEYSSEQIEEILFLDIKNIISKMNGATRSDIYMCKTIETILKNPEIIIEKLNKDYIQKQCNHIPNRIAYTSNMDDNINLLMQDVINVVLRQFPKKLLNYLKEHELTQNEKIELKKIIEEYLKTEYKDMTKTIKTQYENQLSNVVKKLYDEGFLEKYNNKNNERLENMGLDILKYNIDSHGKEARTN